jgi:hypothetical protein
MPIQIGSRNDFDDDEDEQDIALEIDQGLDRGLEKASILRDKERHALIDSLGPNEVLEYVVKPNYWRGTLYACFLSFYFNKLVSTRTSNHRNAHWFNHYCNYCYCGLSFNNRW